LLRFTTYKKTRTRSSNQNRLSDLNFLLFFNEKKMKTKVLTKTAEI